MTTPDNSTLLAEIQALRHELANLRSSVTDIRSLVGPFGVSYPDGSMLVQTVHSIKYLIDPLDDVMARQIIVYRQWEPELSAFMLASADPDTVFMDIGANFGYFTCLVGSRIGRSGRGHVISVEANPRMVDLLRRNITINWSMCPVRVESCAAADHVGHLQFSVPVDRAANAGLGGLASSSSSGVKQFIVPTKNLTALAAGAAVDLLKIDVEGYETMIMRDIESMLAISPSLSIVLEWSPDQMMAAGMSVDEFIEILERARLQAYKVPANRYIVGADLEVLRIPSTSLRELAYDNIYLTRPR